MSISEGLVNDFKSEREKTRKVLQAVPEDQLDWSPHEKSMTLGALAGHIAENPAWIVAMHGDDFDLGDSGGGEGYQPYVPEGVADLVETFEKNAAMLEETVAGWDDEFQQTEWTMRQGDKVLMTQPRHAVIRTILINHGVHHRGQLTVYLRLLGASVPPTYGPTADYPDV